MSEQQLQKVKVNQLAHVGLWASDVAMQARFYRQVVGFDFYAPLEDMTDQNSPIDDDTTLLTLGNEPHTLELINDVRSAVPNGRGSAHHSHLHHLAFEVETDADMAALAARLSMSGIDLQLAARNGHSELGDTVWFSDPDGNRIEIAATPDPLAIRASTPRNRQLRPYALQHIALYTSRLQEMVDFYTESLGFDISDWLLRESVWLRCNSNHHTLVLMQGNQGIDHIGYTIADGPELLRWADYLSRYQTPILWGPGRHGTGNDLFLRFTDPEGTHIELSAELQQYYDSDVTTPPRLWHSRRRALNLWGTMPAWIREEATI